MNVEDKVTASTSSRHPRAEQLQRRLSHYLKSYRAKQQLSPAIAAKQLGYALSRYYKLESESVPYERFISSVRFLHRLAELNHLSFTSFCNYLEHGLVPDSVQSVSTWKTKIVATFDQINTRVLRRFIQHASVQSKEDKEDLETVLSFYVSLQQGNIDRSVAKNILNIVKALEEK